MRLIKPALAAVAASAFAIGACGQQETANNLAIEGDTGETAIAEPEAGGPGDPATGNLMLDSPPSAVDGAINETDAQANLGNAVGNLQ